MSQFIEGYYASWQRLVPPDALESFFTPMRQDVDHLSPVKLLAAVFPERAELLETPADFINWCLYFEAKTFLHGLLIVEDKLSMAHGLELRVPFLDNDLVDFAMGCPPSAKLRDLERRLPLDENIAAPKQETYFQRTNEGKQVLRGALERYLGPNVSTRQKQGFSSPDASWFKGQSVQFVKRRLMNGDSPLYDYVDPITTRSLVQDHLEGLENRRLLIWSLLNVDAWLRKVNPAA